MGQVNEKETCSGCRPEEMSDVGWFAWGKLPSPLFLPLQNLLDGMCYPRRDESSSTGGHRST